MSEFYIGLMSGTSMDAVDAALVDFSPTAPRLLSTYSVPLPQGLQDQLQAPDPPTVDDLGALDSRLGVLFAEAVNLLLQQADIAAAHVEAIGSHGQTIWHAPEDPYASSIQIGDPNIIAERTGVTTIADFRRRDMAAGGQGAPLAPAFHAAVFSAPGEPRAILNLGGIANLTILPAEEDIPVTGFDTGPGNVLLDIWAKHHTGASIDMDGRWAASGQNHDSLLERFLTDTYFHRGPPKSTGREDFNRAWLESYLGTHQIGPRDIQATLVELTAQTVARALARWAPQTQRVIACGGGTLNPYLMTRLQAALGPRMLETTAAHGLDVKWVEAAAFAWLARRTLKGLPGNLPSVTGAHHPAVLGGVYRGH